MDNNYNNYDNSEYSYNPYSSPRSSYQSGSSYDGDSYNGSSYHGNSGNQTPKKKSPFAGFGITLMKTVAIALVFGLVAGVSGTAVLKVAGSDLGIFAEVDKDEDSDKGQEQEMEQNSEKADASGSLQQTSTEAAVNSVMDVSDIVKSAMPCVVAITNTAEVTYQNWWGLTYTQESDSCGTGFIVEQDDEYIYIATNNHVVAGATVLTVQFSDASTAEAEIKGTVASKDLAVIRVALADIQQDTLDVICVASLGDSNELEVGEAAIAIGNALGYGQSVTTGVISALGRSVTVSDSGTGTTIVNNNLIQTDAAINPGNSGGALLNINGEVIGINSVKYADTDVEGIGYAIPISDAMLIIDKLIDGEKIDGTQSGYLGIQGQDSSMGAYVYYVFEGSAAEEAGIKAGDIIIEMEGTEISTMSQLKELLSYYPAGEEIHLVILQSNGNQYEEKEVTVVLGDSGSIPQQ